MTLDTLQDAHGASISTAAGNGHIVRIPAYGIEAPFVLVSRFLDRAQQQAA